MLYLFTLKKPFHPGRAKGHSAVPPSFITHAVTGKPDQTYSYFGLQAPELPSVYLWRDSFQPMGCPSL
ncbi:hypothetical protein CDSM653_00831 [Caldanaerobacter subterraneus subsp. pacificus DSM 12653]|uniref:Uncharacterized protein n=1 Tax=Caldanaerobacter subterraneus subsp. pacificus DSM 12653 TaxID=391606 RepID=A0A0F5PNE6_9THEO|nr:hypothetical protein CDSM653_00831 [Caldanaerobacter subterraneus subsp. pacificus DSM 12653]